MKKIKVGSSASAILSAAMQILQARQAGEEFELSEGGNADCVKTFAALKSKSRDLGKKDQKSQLAANKNAYPDFILLGGVPEICVYASDNGFQDEKSSLIQKAIESKGDLSKEENVSFMRTLLLRPQGDKFEDLEKMGLDVSKEKAVSSVTLKKLEDKVEKLKGVEEEHKKTLEKLTEAEGKLEDVLAELNELNAKYDFAVSELAGAESKISVLEAKVEELSPDKSTKASK